MNETIRENPESYAAVLREVAGSAKELVKSELNLIQAEIKETVDSVSKHAFQTAVFGGLMLLGAIPLVAAVVIWLGEQMDGQYALSALIVGATLTLVGGTLAARAMKKLGDIEVTLPTAVKAMRMERQTIENKSEEIRYAAQGAPA